MNIKKDLNILEILHEMRTLKRVIISLATKKEINKIMKYLQAINLKDICVQSSHNGSDRMINGIIKNLDLSEEIESKLISYNEYKKLAEEKIRQKAETATKAEMIVFYRDELHKDWETIAKAEDYGISQVYRIYKKEKNKQKNNDYFCEKMQDDRQ